MATVQTFHLSHLSANPVHVALFGDVTNAPYLRKQLLEGNSNFEYAFLDATAILSTTHVLAAVFRAINDALNGRLKSRNVHSEIVFSLSPNNNIADSFRRFGILDTTTTLLAIKVSTASSPITTEEVQTHLTSVVEGTPLPFTDAALAQFTDLARIRKIYKLDSATPSQRGKNPKKGAKKQEVNGDGVNGVNSVTDEPVDEKKEMEAVVLGIMALKGS